MVLGTLAVVLALAQSGPPTVGDTIWVTRTVRVPIGAVVRPPEWDLKGDVELLGPARVALRGDWAEVAYPVVAWVPGAHPLAIPGPVLLHADGAVDSLPAEPITLTVASVLPDVPADSALAPQPPVTTVPRMERRPLPVAVALGAALLLLLPVHFFWRRRRRPEPFPATAIPAGPPYDRWADAGETRAVLAATAAELRATIARRDPAASRALDVDAFVAHIRAAHPEWPRDELADFFGALEEARFAAPSFGDAMHLRSWARELHEKLDAIPMPAAAEVKS